MTASAITAAKASNYKNAGTVEFLYAIVIFYFMEVTTLCRVMNTLDLCAAVSTVAAGHS